jgi:lipoprotein NlpI
MTLRSMLFPARPRSWVAGLSVAVGAFVAGAVSGAETNSEELVRLGSQAFKKGNRSNALAFFTRAITANPSNFIAYYNRGRQQENEGRYTNALADYDTLIRLKPDHPAALQLRGSLRLRLSQIEGAIADFDRYVALVPKDGPKHWQRGVAYYLAGRYEDGRRQFALAHGANTNDAEHALWHFLCIARSDGLEKARAGLLPVGADNRVPMQALYALFAGRAKPEDVFKAAEARTVNAVERSMALFLAHYYVGLYYEASGDALRAQEYMTKAASLGTAGEFFSDMARVQVRLRTKSVPSVPQ